MLRRLVMMAALLFLAAIPAKADDADIKKAQPGMVDAYMAAYNKQDAAGLAAIYTADAILVNPMTGVQPASLKFFESWFADGPRTIATKFENAWQINADVGLGQGTYVLTGKTLKGDPVDFKGGWTTTYVRQDGKWKIRQLTSFPLPPPKQ